MITDTDLAFGEYEQARKNYADATNIANSNKMGILDLKYRMDQIEALLVTTGGTAEYPITGSNAEQRKASLAVCLLAHTEYAKTLTQVRDLEETLATAELKRENAASIMRIARLRIELQTSENFREAALLGNHELSRAH